MVISAAIAAVTIGSVIYGYVMTAQRAEWSAYSLAGESLALQGIERVRAAKWDLESTPVVDQVIAANFPVRTAIMDIPVSGTNLVYAFIITTIADVSLNPPLRRINVACVWYWNPGGRWFTNQATTCRAPDT